MEESFANGTIILFDDEEGVISLITRVLRRISPIIRVASYKYLDLALVDIARFYTSGANPNFILGALLDINGMNSPQAGGRTINDAGYQLGTLLLKNDPNLPIYLISGLPEVGSQHVFKGYFEKPFSYRHLEEVALREFLPRFVADL